MTPSRSHRRSGGSDRGVTLVELLVGVIIGLTMMTLVWSVFISDQRRFAVDQNRLSGLAGVVTFHETLSADLERLITFLDVRRSPQFYLQAPVEIGGDLRSLVFLAAKEAGDGNGLVGSELIEYRLDPSTSRIVRRTPTETRVFRNLLVDQLVFSETAARLKPELESAPSSYNAQTGIHVIRYHVTCVSEAVLTPGARPVGEHEQVTLVGAIPLQYVESRENHPYHMYSAVELPEIPTPLP